jgi:hypothetical protein
MAKLELNKVNKEWELEGRPIKDGDRIEIKEGDLWRKVTVIWNSHLSYYHAEEAPQTILKSDLEARW